MPPEKIKKNNVYNCNFGMQSSVMPVVYIYVSNILI